MRPSQKHFLPVGSETGILRTSRIRLQRSGITRWKLGEDCPNCSAPLCFRLIDCNLPAACRVCSLDLAVAVFDGTLRWQSFARQPPFFPSKPDKHFTDVKS